MNEEIFRAYDIRGKYPTEINEDLAYTISAKYCKLIAVLFPGIIA